ncbi:MAG: hypothetical protein ACE5ID_00455, partial [Acidobacteriota bacterium]
MSTDLEQDPAALEPISAVSDLTGWFAAGCKPEEQFGLGLEYERLGVFKDNGRAIPYFGSRSVRTILESLVRQRGWTEHREGENPIALSRCGTRLTLEPGGQTELSSRVHPSLSDM